MLKPLHPWHVAPGKEDRINESIAENFSLDNHHSENTGNGIPPRHSHSYQESRKRAIDSKRIILNVIYL